MAVDGAAAFPDAVSERGTKHLKELMRLKRRGHRAAVVFVIQTRRLRRIPPRRRNRRRIRTLAAPRINAGVEALPYRAKVTSQEIVLTEQIETKL